MNKKMFAAAGAFLLLAGWLLYVHQAGKPPRTPQMTRTAVNGLLRIYRRCVETRTLPPKQTVQSVLAGSAGWDSLALFEDRRRWYLGRGTDAATAFLRLCRERLQDTNRTPQELYLSFIGPRKSVPYYRSAVWNFTVLPGLDGLWYEDRKGVRLMLPEEGGAYGFSGGQLVSFLPVRFGLNRDRVLGSLFSQRPLQQSLRGTGRRFRLVHRPLPAEERKIFRFRSSDWYAALKDGAYQPKALYRGAVQVTPAEVPGIMAERIRLAGDWFLAHLNRAGQFSYRYYPHSGETRAGDYSFPRHAGTTLILYRIYRHTGLKQYLEAGDRALVWILRYRRSGKPGSWIADQGSGGKLGTTALTALTLLARRDALLRTGSRTPEAAAKYDRELHSLLQFITNQMRPDGSLRHYYHPHIPKDPRVAQNFPGQALWALAKGALIDSRYLPALERGLDYQCGKFWNFFLSEYYVFPFSWEMQAIADIYPKLHKPLYRRFLYETAVSMFDSQYLDDAPFPDYKGGFGTPEWFVPLAHAAGFQLEGLSGAWYYARQSGDKGRMESWKKRLEYTVAFLFSQQVTPASSWFHRDPSKSVGGFRGGPADNRHQIDYSQHSLAGILNLLEEGMWQNGR